MKIENQKLFVVISGILLFSVPNLSVIYAQTTSTGGGMGGMNMSGSGHGGQGMAGNFTSHKSSGGQGMAGNFTSHKSSGGQGMAGNFTSHKSSGSSSSHMGVSSATTPEFGPVVSIVLVLSIVSLIIISVRTKLRFSQF